MDICFNSLTITAPATTIDCILSRGVENYKASNWNRNPQDFSFKSLIEALTDHPVDLGNLEDIWVNWIECSGDDERQKLIIEFESRQTPPVYCIDALIQCLEQEQLTYELFFKYRLENQEWDGEISASSNSISN